MNYTIISKEQDLAGKWRLTISINNESPIVLKFQSDPNDEEVTNAVNYYIEHNSYNPQDPEILAFRQKYLQVTEQLCLLAGESYTGKLTNTQYESVAIKACMSNNPIVTLLLTSILYCRTVLRELDGENWWNNI